MKLFEGPALGIFTTGDATQPSAERGTEFGFIVHPHLLCLLKNEHRQPFSLVYRPMFCVYGEPQQHTLSSIFLYCLFCFNKKAIDTFDMLTVELT